MYDSLYIPSGLTRLERAFTRTDSDAIGYPRPNQVLPSLEGTHVHPSSNLGFIEACKTKKKKKFEVSFRKFVIYSSGNVA